MKAFVKFERGPGHVGVREMDDPVQKEDEVLIRIAAAGLCHSDFLMVDWVPTIEREWNPTLPIVMGHEFSGTIAGIGSRVEGFNIGDHVVVNPILECGTCRYCGQGKQELCIRKRVLGISANGGFAEKVAVRARNVYRLPPSIDLEIAALCEPFNTVINAFEKARPGYGDSVLISGPGPMGILSVIMARYSGCGQIFMTGLTVDRERLDLAERLGAVAINLQQEDAQAKVRDMTGGEGVAIAIETSGSGRALVQDLSFLRKCGKLMVVGLAQDPAPIIPSDFALNETEMIGIRSYTLKTWETCLNILGSQRIDLRPLITHRLALEDGEMAFQMHHQKKGLKIFFQPSGAGVR